MAGFVASITVLTVGIASKGGPILEQHLFYKTREEAENALKYLSETDVGDSHYAIDDDFGTTLSFADGEFVRLSDMEKSLDLQVEQGLLQARAQARAQQRAAQDPTLALLNAAGGASPPAQSFRPRSVPRP